MTVTEPRAFVGANIKGTPKMSRRKVAEDLRTLRAHADLVVIQEFRHRSYWLALAANLRHWGSYPNAARGLARPVWAGQPVAWRRRVWRRVAGRVALLHKGRAGISEDRYLRAVLVEDRATGLRAWHGGTHNVVGGDEPTDGPVRRAMLDEDLDRLAGFLDDLASTGEPVVWHMDANVHRGTEAYRRLVEIVRSRGGVFHGEHGVEYLFVMHGAHTRVEVVASWRLRAGDHLNTDHEARGITYRLRTR